MRAFGHEPKSWPPEWQFEEFATRNRFRWLKDLRDREHYTGSAFRLVCQAVLHEYGLEWGQSMGHISVLIDFFKYAKSSSVRRAEQQAWEGITT